MSMHFLWQVDVDLQQHQETGLSIFVQNGHPELTDCGAYEGCGVCVCSSLTESLEVCQA